MYQCAYRLLGQQDLAEDVVQDAFLKLYRSQKIDFKTVKNWRNYLKSMASNLAYDQLRMRQRQPVTQRHNATLADVEGLSGTVDSLTPERALASQQCLAELRIALTQLNRQDYQVFTLRFIEELSYQEIAEQLNISKNLVGVTLHRSQKKLADLLPTSVTGESYVTS